MRSFLRLLQLLTMVTWVGGLLFFAFALAPIAFHVLPVREAGLVVGGVLRVFHLVGIGCGVIFALATELLVLRVPSQSRRWFGLELLLASGMLLLTAFLQVKTLPAMDRDQAQAGGDVNVAAITNPARIDFDRLHVLSERLESLVLLCGLGILFLLSRDSPSADRIRKTSPVQA